MCQEKEEKEDSPTSKITSMNQHKNLKASQEEQRKTYDSDQKLQRLYKDQRNNDN